MQLAGSKDGGWVYADRHPGSKMEIPDNVDYVNKVDPTMGSLVAGSGALIDLQDPAASFVHGMSDGLQNQNPTVAEALGDAYVGQNVSTARAAQAAWLASGHAGFSPKALLAFGNALHTVTDRTSSTHAGNQPWRGAQGAGNLAAAMQHVRGEMYPTAPQLNNAIAQARWSFAYTFGTAAAQNATKPAPKKREPKEDQTLLPFFATEGGMTDYLVGRTRVTQDENNEEQCPYGAVVCTINPAQETILEALATTRGRKSRGFRCGQKSLQLKDREYDLGHVDIEPD